MSDSGNLHSNKFTPTNCKSQRKIRLLMSVLFGKYEKPKNTLPPEKCDQLIQNIKNYRKIWIEY